MTILRKTLMALGFLSLGSLGTVGLTAVASNGFDGPRAERAHHGGPEDGLRALGVAMSRLDLSDEQQDALEDARDDIRDKLSEAREGATDDREELRQALVDGSLERNKVKARIQARMAEAEEMVLYTVDRVFDVYETLDEEQRTELVALLDQLAERHEQMRSKRGRRGEGPRSDLDRSQDGLGDPEAAD